MKFIDMTQKFRMLPDDRTKGFTLVELLMVCALVAILIGIAVPSYRAQQVSSFRQLAQVELSALLVQLHTLRAVISPDEMGELIPLSSYIQNETLKSRYDFELIPNPLVAGKDFHLVGMAKKNQAGDGGLTLSSLGEGCWHKDVDRPAAIACKGYAW